MNKSFVIQWKSKVNGRAGKGSKLFDRLEAERLEAALVLQGFTPRLPSQGDPAQKEAVLRYDRLAESFWQQRVEKATAD